MRPRQGDAECKFLVQSVVPRILADEKSCFRKLCSLLQVLHFHQRYDDAVCLLDTIPEIECLKFIQRNDEIIVPGNNKIKDELPSTVDLSPENFQILCAMLGYIYHGSKQTVFGHSKHETLASYDRAWAYYSASPHATSYFAGSVLSSRIDPMIHNILHHKLSLGKILNMPAIGFVAHTQIRASNG